MKRLLTAARRLLYPPQWVMLWMPPPVFAALIAVLAGGHSHSAAAYPIYGLSAYCLVIVLLPLPRLFCRGRTAVIRWISCTAYGKRYLESPAFRAAVSILREVAVDFLYAAFRVTVGLRYASVWWDCHGRVLRHTGRHTAVAGSEPPKSRDRGSILL